ncbi:MAG: septum formation protein Maf [Candidatus Omnitrophica bacterium]|nr:septum formation protein Maf [Candidatus Omnitrophota bacterium]
MKPETVLYLASQSPRRRQLLKRLRRPFRVVPSAWREAVRAGQSPSRNAMRNARGKACKAALPPRAQGVVIGADTFLYFRGRILGKPKTQAQARRMLANLSGRSHWVYTGVCLRDVESGRCRLSYAKSHVTFRRAAHETIARYVARIKPLDKAGGYAVQEDRGVLIARIEGSRTNVIGLPLELLRRELAAFGSPVREAKRHARFRAALEAVNRRHGKTLRALAE